MLGVCYYPEQWPQSDWRDDARRMVDVGISHVRVAEFAWARIEPARGRFAWAWLDEAIGILGDAGLHVVMCTPTATPPKWLIDERPEILAWDEAGRPRGFGSRRHYCFASPAWREETGRICEIVADRYGEHDAVVGWQLDNEYGCHDTVLSYAPHCRTAFREWLAQRYGTPEALNAAWGNVFWSQAFGTFDEVGLPNLTVTEANPAHRLDYRRFASDMVVAYNRLQVEVVRARSPGRFISHNGMGFFDGYDHFAVAGDLDVFTWDSYPLGHTDQRLDAPDDVKARFARTGHPDVAPFHHDLYRGVGNGRWWVMEQQPGPVNWAANNPAPMPGMVRLWTLEALSHGAEVVSYFRWRQAPFAQEQMHAGLLRPDGADDIGAAEASQVAAELKALDLAPSPASWARVALVFDYTAAWVTRIQPQGAGFRVYNLAMRFYTALRRLGLDVDIVGPGRPLAGYALIVAPTLPILEPSTIAALRAAEGQVVLGPRTGSKIASFQIPETLPPGPVQSNLPIKVIRVSSLRPGVADEITWTERRYAVEIWREYVETDLAPLARFGDGSPAVLRSGHWHYLAFWPEETFLLDYLEHVAAEVALPTVRLPETLRLRRRGNIRFAFNYGNAPAPAAAGFVLGQRTIEPYDVAAWRVTDEGEAAE